MVIGTAVVLVALQAHPGGPASKSVSGGVSNVTISPQFFNPSLGQAVSIAFKTTAPGTVSVTVLDRDGFRIKKLPAVSVTVGEQKIAWDGRDDNGYVVPDEAYSFRIELISQNGKDVYFPANTVPKRFEVPPRYYDRREATLLYELPVAARVYIQAGEAALDPAVGRNSGPVLKNVVNREPRTAGRIVEHWSGLDDTGALYIPALPHFMMAIACTPLPENSVIATGNRQRTFLSYVGARHGTSLITKKPPHDHHHGGLMTFDDLSPSLIVSVLGGVRHGVSNCWEVSSQTVRFDVNVAGPTSQHFRSQPGKLHFFDGTRTLKVVAAKTGLNQPELSLALTPGEKKILAVNWASDYGPTAPGIVCIEQTKDTARTAGESGQ